MADTTDDWPYDTPRDVAEAVAACQAHRHAWLLVQTLNLAARLAEEYVDAHPDECECPTCASRDGYPIRRQADAIAWVVPQLAGLIDSSLYGPPRLTDEPLAKQFAELARRVADELPDPGDDELTPTAAEPVVIESGASDRA